MKHTTRNEKEGAHHTKELNSVCRVRMLSTRRILALTKEAKDLFLSLQARFLSTEYYDPPFSPLSKPSKPKKTKTKKPPQQDQSSEPPVNNPPAPATSDLPFDFRYSYSETNPAIEPIGFREPKRFSPFGPGRLDRNWTGTCAPASPESYDQRQWAEERVKILGEALTEEEVNELVERYRHNDCSRQINLGKYYPKASSFGP